MKILVIAKGRCGSHSLIDWLGEEFDLKTIYETEDTDTSNLKNYCIKRFPTPDLVTEGYDYIIRLIRENTILTAESDVWAEEKQKYHPRGKEKYIIDEAFLRKHHNEIWNKKIGYDESNDLIKNMTVKGIVVTYEELFLYGTGQEKIEKYIGFKSTSKLNTDLKKGRFHVMDKTVYTTYDLAYNKTTILEEIIKQKDLVINNLNEKIKNSSDPQEMFNEKDLIINNLNEKIKNLNETIVDLVSSKKK
jgi:hypothetical protein